MSNKNILRRFVFIFVLFSISYCSFHDFTFKTVYDNTCKLIVEQSTKVTDLSSHDTKNVNPIHYVFQNMNFINLI